MTVELLPGVTGVLVLANGTVLQGVGVGATGVLTYRATVQSEAVNQEARLDLVADIMASGEDVTEPPELSGRDKIRLAFCYPTPETIHEGIRRLATVIQQETELVETFQPPVRRDVPGSHFQSPPPDLT